MAGRMRIKKILVANRGEIAVRVMRAARTMGIASVAVFSEADRDSLHVVLADEAYCIGGRTSAESYLCVDKIAHAIKSSGADAVHPGYGFLSENPALVEACEELGVIFIGPTADNIRAMGDKLQARDLMQKAGVPIVRGSRGSVESLDEARALCEDIGFPVIIKASAGGGGKGIRVVESPGDLAGALRATQSEGRNYFSDPRVFIEQFIKKPKHIEVQVFADTRGNVVHLFERECSVQRRHQKLIEEAPSVSVRADVRERMGQVAVAAARSINYVGAGTMEFIFDSQTQEFFFMEMNTRLQVEHAVTEMVTGFDLVQEQIRVACGEALSFSQQDIAVRGHAIELRVCAEDPVSFVPAPGRIRSCRVPQGPFVRVDGSIYAGLRVPIYYDPMLAKLIAWGRTRELCVGRLQAALAEFFLTGVKTNLPLHRSVLKHPRFLDGSYTTKFLSQHLEELQAASGAFIHVDNDALLLAAAVEAFCNSQKAYVGHKKMAKKWRASGRVGQLKGHVL